MSRLWWVAAAGLGLWLAGAEMDRPAWPGPSEPLATTEPSLPAEQEPAAHAAHDSEVRKLPFCVVAGRRSSGELGGTVLYRAESRQESGREALRVGYFAYWSTERPWGEAGLDPSLLRALFTDAVYSHFLFVLPGLQRLLYGPGDIEGVRVTYVRGSNGWVAVAATADDGLHREVALDPSDFRDDRGRVLFMSNVWSHQLGAHQAVQAASRGAQTSCFSGDTLLPLTEGVARAFRLGTPRSPRRARPAWRLLDDG